MNRRSIESILEELSGLVGKIQPKKPTEPGNFITPEERIKDLVDGLKERMGLKD